jgi:hypothetical protein
MKVDKVTGLVLDLDDSEYARIQHYCCEVITGKRQVYPLPDFAAQWQREMGFSDDQMLVSANRMMLCLSFYRPSQKF